jgi:Na+/H+-dicarboxylate symporter
MVGFVGGLVLGAFLFLSALSALSGFSWFSLIYPYIKTLKALQTLENHGSNIPLHMPTKVSANCRQCRH